MRIARFAISYLVETFQICRYNLIIIIRVVLLLLIRESVYKLSLLLVVTLVYIEGLIIELDNIVDKVLISLTKLFEVILDYLTFIVIDKEKVYSALKL